MIIVRIAGCLVLIVALLLTGPVLTLAFGPVSFRGDWSTASHRSTGRAPNPATHKEAIATPATK